MEIYTIVRIVGSIISSVFIYAIAELNEIMHDIRTNTEHIRDSLESEKNNMEQKSRKESSFIKNFKTLLIAIFIIIVGILGIVYFINSIKIDNSKKVLQENDIRKNDSIILYNISDKKAVNQYGYIVYNQVQL